MRCQSLKADGQKCRAFAINGQTTCLFHCPVEIRKAAIELPLSREEKICILSREIRSAQKIKNRGQRSAEIRFLMEMLNSLQGEGKNENNSTLDPIEKVVKEWKKSQI